MDKTMAIETLQDMKGVFSGRGQLLHKQYALLALDLAISALEKQSDKNCSRCADKNQCAIHKNFNIDYCSDWSMVEE